jgi:hypothetical protein
MNKNVFAFENGPTSGTKSETVQVDSNFIKDNCPILDPNLYLN